MPYYTLDGNLNGGAEAVGERYGEIFARFPVEKVSGSLKSRRSAIKRVGNNIGDRL